jgi:EpsI family protein
MSGIPALRQEHLIVLPAGRLSIDTACSGLRFLLAALTLGVFYAYFNYGKTWSRALVVLICAGAAIVLNFLRVYIVVYLAYVTEMQHPLVRDHLGLGWILFGGLVLILLAIDFAFVRSRGNAGMAGSRGGRPVAGGVCNYGYTRLGVALFAALVLLSAAPATARWTQGSIVAAEPVVPVLPAGTGGWSGPAAADDRWRPVYQGAFAQQRAYRKDGHELSLYIGYYPVQTQGSEVINDLNRIGGTGYWREVYSRGRPTRVGESMVLEQVLERGDQQRLVWYWYRIAGCHTVNRYEAKWLQALGLLRGDLHASVVALAVDPRDNMAAARKLLGEFMGAMEHALVRAADGNQPG